VVLLAGGDPHRFGADRDHQGFVVHLVVTDPRTAALDEPLCLTLRGDKAKPDQRVEYADAASHRERGQRIASGAFLEGTACGFGRLGGGGFAAAQSGGCIGEYLLGVVDAGAFERLQPRNLVERQIGEKPQETPDIAIVRVAPELPVIIGRELLLPRPTWSCPSCRRPPW